MRNLSLSMSDIFISYSSKDQNEALMLTQRLQEAGYNVWTDRFRIDGTREWATQIVEALNNCTTLLFLVSRHSVTSHNCMKEVHLASEKQKHILPVLLEDIPIPVNFEYQLAGLQRVSVFDQDAILRSLQALNADEQDQTEATPNAQESLPPTTKRLAVLPFDDLSPAHDHEWFAHGMMDELIGTLGAIDSISISPRTDVLRYAKDRPALTEIAADLYCRYIVEGSVQKLGDRIRIRVSLVDALNRIQMWSEKYAGTFDDIFDMQESVAGKITEALEVILSPDDEKSLKNRKTTSSEAFELYMRAKTHYDKQTRHDLDVTVKILQEAIRIDPEFVDAHVVLSNSLLELYRTYSRDPELLRRAEEVAQQIRSIVGESPVWHYMMGHIKLLQGDPQAALDYTQSVIHQGKELHLLWSIIANSHNAMGNVAETAHAREMIVELPSHRDNIGMHFNLIVTLIELGDEERLMTALYRAAPLFERYVRLHPDNLNALTQYAIILERLGNTKKATEIAMTILDDPDTDARSFYNLGSLLVRLGDLSNAVKSFRLSFQKGLAIKQYLLIDPDLEPLRQDEEFNRLISEIENAVS